MERLNYTQIIYKQRIETMETKGLICILIEYDLFF